MNNCQIKFEPLHIMVLKERILQYIETATGDFNALALSVFLQQYQHCKAYQHYCQQLNKTPDNVHIWQDIPAVSTEVFREFSLTTLPESTARYVFQTSGTSQEKKGRHYYHDTDLYDAAIRASFMKGIGMTCQDRPIFRVLTSSFSDVQTSSLSYMFEKVLTWYGDKHSKFYFKEGELQCEQLAHDLLQNSAADHPVVLLGTAFSFVIFCDYLREYDLTLSLPKTSRLLETGGLKGRTRATSREDLYDLFSICLGLDKKRCFSEYGMTELSSQCYSYPDSHIFTSPHWMPVRIIDPESGQEVSVGETGLVQFFDLANETGVSAIVTSDLAIRHVQGFELIGRAPKAVLRGCSTLYEI